MDVTAPRASVRGFSLVELVTTLFIALILISVGVPSWRNLSSSIAIGDARNLLMGSMALARQTAIDSGFHLTLCPSDDQLQCSGDYTKWQYGMLLFIDENANRQKDAGEALIRSFGEQLRIVIQSSSGRRSIRYAPDGSAWGSNLTLRFCSPHNAAFNKAIILYGSGRARLSSTLSNGNPITCI